MITMRRLQKKKTKQKQAAIITSTHPDFSESKFFYPPIGGIGRHSSKFKALKKNHKELKFGLNSGSFCRCCVSTVGVQLTF